MAEINYNELDALLSTINVAEINPDADDKYEELPDGYYLSEVEKAELTTSKNSGNPQVAMTFKVVEDGIAEYINDKGFSAFKNIEHSKNRKIFKYYPLTNEKTVRAFVKDMLKFEGDVQGESLLPEEAFTTSAVLEDAISILIGCRLYVQVSNTIKKGTDEKQSWKNLISWNRAKGLGLPD